MKTRRLGFYRALQLQWVGGRLAPWLLRKRGRFGQRADEVHRTPPSPRREGARRLWFHAASVGELESLWSVVHAATAAGPVDLVLTVFSDSAIGAVERLAGELKAIAGARIEFVGYSPWEGGWESCLKRYAPDAFVTAKYEAWPELWAALGEAGISLVVVGALSRKSFKTAKAACAWLGAELPRMTLLAASKGDVAPLAQLFPSAKIEATGDPRWDRVRARNRKGSSRATALISAFAHWPRPWGVLGSAWDADLRFWSGALGRRATAGTFWVVPHKVDPTSVAAMIEFLKGKGLKPMRSSQVDEAASTSTEDEDAPACVLVDEMGFLSELYAAADWAYVGGGFGDGVHSTIEPALHGIPVAIGPARADRFPEIAELRSTGQLSIVRSREGLDAWLSDLGLRGSARRSEWLTQAEARFGATDRVWRRISEAMVTS